jgi:hypothetical protein
MTLRWGCVGAMAQKNNEDIAIEIVQIFAQLQVPLFRNWP